MALKDNNTEYFESKKNIFGNNLEIYGKLRYS